MIGNLRFRLLQPKETPSEDVFPTQLAGEQVCATEQAHKPFAKQNHSTRAGCFKTLNVASMSDTLQRNTNPKA